MPKTNTIPAPLRILAEKFDILLAAPGGIQEMRELVLLLAVQGKLVEQDPRDEPASKLLERIGAEKKRKAKESKAKRTKPPPPILEEDIAYGLPEGWEWARFGDVATIAANLVKPEAYRDFPHIAPNNIEKGTGRLLEYRTVGEDDVRSGNHRFYSSQIVYSKIRPNLAKATIVDFDGLCSADMYPIEAHIHTAYLLKFMLSRPFLLKAVRHDTRVAMPKINQEELNAIPVAVPPLPEQKRIVARLTKLMALCDGLEARQQKAREDRVRVHDASVDRLLSAQDADEFAEHWQRICDNFDLFYDDPANLAKLRQAILQLAVQGKLVSQDPNDEPASELLKRIEAEKERLVKEGAIKKPKPSPTIREAEGDYGLPDNWELVNVDSVSLAVQYGFTASARAEIESPKFLRITDIQDSRVQWDLVPGCEIDTELLPAYELHEGDILIARTGGTIGKSYLVDGALELAVFASYLIRVVPSTNILPAFLKLFLESPDYWRQLTAKSMGTGQPNVNGTALRSLVFGLPPLAEQRRIETKVDALMSLCDALENRLDSSRAVSENLLKSVIHQVANASPLGA